MMENLILRLVSKFVIPFILLFGLYVQAHGDYGPGADFRQELSSQLALYYSDWFLDWMNLNEWCLHR